MYIKMSENKKSHPKELKTATYEPTWGSGKTLSAVKQIKAMLEKMRKQLLIKEEEKLRA